ncbi:MULTISPECIES: beta-ketoacyl-[acyl-carrier-protein] synthase family protein [unclassified Streptomyces]|uniref:beta-ketoacyl-[acyl-carrier-protein] synthase family protein n=1 Tax=unclassified Streptomyces TaxID=2593676 RepID=UPI00036B6F4B|nr:MULTISPECIES: beta-ketoacyl-[acyl-carrier-protein] synthase family protein [unclassified Streptomyces]MYT30240.1 beta-ketoacyl-[acyl-carrier-protein] synthase family protein [Streptomyces sp. SID8354]
MSRRVVVTGLGAVCGLGLDWQTMWDGLTAGRSAIRAWRPPGVDDFPVRYAAPVDDAEFAARYGAEADPDRPLERRTRFGLAAAAQALADAGLDAPGTVGRIGTAVGSGVPERDPYELLHAIGEDGLPSWQTLFARRDRLDRASGLFCTNDALAAGIAARHRLRGPALNFSTACAGATHAIGHGLRMIRRGEVDAMVVGGADSVLNLPTMTGLHLLGAPSTSELFGDRLCRAFDRDRSGLVAAEGAAMLVLESEESARRRGAAVYAELAGFGSSLDAYQVTAPHPEGHGAALAMSRALADGGVAPEAVDSVNAHGTSTPLNDPIETRAIKDVFAAGEHYRKLAVTANKTMLGHLIAAAGAPELIATVLSVRDGIVPPTLNLENPDPACDLDYVPEKARYQEVSAAVSNSFGFGGLNASLVVRGYEH